MSYRLELDGPVGAAVTATADERLAHAIAQLRETAAEDRTSAIHDARKDIKKLRSLLRLAQPGLDRHARRAENTELAEIGRSLSATRDADVMVEVIDDLAERAAGYAPAATFDALRRQFDSAAQDAQGETDDAALERAAQRLEGVRERIAVWMCDGLDDAALIAGHERAYRRGRADFLAVAGGEASDEQLHDWRKRVKDLWYQQRLLSDAWPGVLAAQIGELDALADLLGDDHDLAVLRALLVADQGAVAGAAVDVEPVVAAIDQRRRELGDEAVRIGRRVYAEKPGAYARRHARYLDAARAEAA